MILQKTLRFNMEIPEEAAAYEAVASSGRGNGNKFVLDAITAFLSKNNDFDLLQEMRQIIREEIEKAAKQYSYRNRNHSTANNIENEASFALQLPEDPPELL